MSNNDRLLLAEQREYYEARASEYDEWWHRRGRYDLGAEENAAWRAEAAQVEHWVATLPGDGEVLELAAGTGTWTRLLARDNRRVDVVDGAAAMIALNRARLAGAGLADRVRYAEADLFDWRATRRYELVFFGFWLSHVPGELRDTFFAMVRDALRPGGTLALVDGRPGPAPATVERFDEQRIVRQLNDGRRFAIVKRFDDPAALGAALAEYDIAATFTTTARFFLYGSGVKQAEG